MTQRMSSVEYRRMIGDNSTGLLSDLINNERISVDQYKLLLSGKKIDCKPNKRPAKYRNEKCMYQGMKFDSQGERDRWIQLCMWRDNGIICRLERQVYFCVLDGTPQRPIMWVPDFVYEQDGQKIVEDFKSEITRKKRDFIDKVKMFKARHKDYIVLISSDKGVTEWK